MKTLFRYALYFLLAVIVTSLLASVFSTQFVIAGLQSINADITLATRLSMTIGDFGILQTLIAATAGCFLVGFLVAAGCIKLLGGYRTVWYTIAGASALCCLLLLMSWQMQLMPIAGARSLLGMLFQAIAGAAGGYLFAHLSESQNNETI